jgi:hypothetical protein
MNKQVKITASTSKKVNVKTFNETPSAHTYESIDNIDMMNELDDREQLEEDFLMIAGMSLEEARQASINVRKYDQF